MMMDVVRAALANRAPLLTSLHGEGTDCYRLFHGATEGLPGCTLERFGDMLLWQTFREPPDLPPEQLLPLLRDLVEEETGVALKTVYWNARQRRQQSREGAIPAPPSVPLRTGHVGSEMGLKYSIGVPAPGRDANLYLDFRSARRWLRANSQGRTVLNAFAFTCGAGVAASAGGASKVTNLDFSQTALDIGRENARLNGLPDDNFECLCGDALPALRQFAGLPVNTDRRRSRHPGASRGRGSTRGRPSGRGQGSRPLKLRYQQFDVV